MKTGNMKVLTGYVIFGVIYVICIILPIHSALRLISRKFDKNRRIPAAQIIGSVKLSLKYCKTKALIHEKPVASRHCIRRWNRLYSKHCKKRKGDSVKCQTLRQKASKLRNDWINARIKHREVRKRHSFICGDDFIDGRKYHCCGRARFELKTSGCCNTQIYKKAEEGCCGGIVFLKKNQDCCYDIVFDKNNELCCNLHVYSIDGSQKTVCCGNESIDSRNYFCNNGTPFVKDSFWNGSKQNPIQRNGDHQSHEKDDVTFLLLIAHAVSSSILLVVWLAVTICCLCVINKKRSRSQSRDMSNSDKTGVSTITVHRKRLNNDVYLSSLERTHTDMDLLDSGEPFAKKLVARTNIHMSERDLENPASSVAGGGTLIAETKKVIEEVSEVISRVDSDTQTANIKPVNIQNSMGRPFDLEFVFNSNHKTLQIPDSSAVLTLSDIDTREEATCLASTFRYIPELYSKLQLDDNRCIASPAVEYRMLGKSELKTLAKVTMPFIGDAKRLTVLKVTSDNGSGGPVETKEIKRFDDSCRGDDEEYYEIIRPGLLAIYVRSMSWLVCLNCSQMHDFQLEEIVYGKLNESPENPSQLRAFVGSYIVDEIHLIPDYRKLLEDTEKEKERVQVLERRMKLPATVDMSDSIRISLTLETPNGTWEHVTASTGSLLQVEEEDIPLHRITTCHEGRIQNGLPFAKEWYLRSNNTPDEHAWRFSCIINTAHLSHSTGVVSETDSHPLDTYLMYNSFHKRQNAEKSNVINYPVTIQAVPPSSHVQQPADIQSRDNDENEASSENLYGQPENPFQTGELALPRTNRREGNEGRSLVRGETSFQTPSEDY